MTPSAPASPGSDQEPGELALPRPPGIFRRWIDRHPRTVDVAIALVTVGIPGTVWPLVSASDTSWLVVALTLAFAVVLFVATLFRRRYPVLLLALALAIAVALVPVEYRGVGVASGWVALYSIAVFQTSRRAWIGYGCATVCWLVSAQLDGSSVYALDRFPTTPPEWINVAGMLFQAAFTFIVPTLVGLWVGGRRRYEHALIARARDLARERDQRARLAVSEERTRIAREMHDIVSHSLTVMITLSEGAAAQAEAGTDRAPEAMRRVADAGRDSLADMRRLLGVLRAPGSPADLAPQPGAANIPTLVSRFRDAGLPVTWRSEGDPIPEGGLALTCYRIVQESLTNVLRHAPGTRGAEVTATHADGTITLTIDNESTPGSAPSDGSGRGLVGMRERAALHGGSVEAGPRPDGRWRVRVTLPTEEKT